jgi:RHS repeat-associated protein
VTQLVYPTGRTVNYTHDSANRPSTATDAANGITYAADWKTPPSNTSCTTGAVCYTPQGSVYSMSIGQTSSFTGFNISETFNNRLQPSEIKASSSAGSAIDITYNFVDPSSQGNAGHVYGITNNLNSSRSQAFTYDQVNRITSAGTTATTGTYCWGYQYSSDAWGNLLSQAGWSPTYNGCTETTMGTVTADGNNHISAMSYDASGNTQGDGNSTYTWDGESQMKTAAGVTYAYDGDGRRVAKVGSKLYWYGSGGEILSETDAAGNTLNEYVFFGGKRVALVPASGGALYYAEDMLGSSRVMVQANGTLCYDADFTPFGGERSYTSTCAQNYKFQGKERDTETGNDDFGARYYSWRFGRWLSSDWSAVPVAVPYANLTNPQTLNLYAMVADDPETSADLDGHSEKQSGYDGWGRPISTPIYSDEETAYAQGVDDIWRDQQRAVANAQYAGQVPDAAQNNSVQQPALVPLANDVHYTVANNGPNAPEVHPVFSPETAEHLNAAFKELNKDGITPQINSAFRTNSDQAYMQSGGSGTNPAAKVSWHQAGAAVDINGTRSPQFKTIISVMKKNGFSWGGDYKSKKDPPHFDGRQFMGNLNQAVRKAQSYWDSTQ